LQVERRRPRLDTRAYQPAPQYRTRWRQPCVWGSRGRGAGGHRRACGGEAFRLERSGAQRWRSPARTGKRGRSPVRSRRTALRRPRFAIASEQCVRIGRLASRPTARTTRTRDWSGRARWRFGRRRETDRW